MISVLRWIIHQSYISVDVSRNHEWFRTIYTNVFFWVEWRQVWEVYAKTLICLRNYHWLCVWYMEPLKLSRKYWWFQKMLRKSYCILQNSWWFRKCWQNLFASSGALDGFEKCWQNLSECYRTFDGFRKWTQNFFLYHIEPSIVSGNKHKTFLHHTELSMVL